MKTMKKLKGHREPFFVSLFKELPVARKRHYIEKYAMFWGLFLNFKNPYLYVENIVSLFYTEIIMETERTSSQ
jgi:hypothetical protein